MKLRSVQVAALAIVFVFGGIFISSLMGVWRTESSKIPAAYTSGEFAGEYNPADIRGSYTFEDIAEAFDVPVRDLSEAYGFDKYDNPAALQVKIFEDTFGEIDGKEIGTDSVRLFVALYLSRPYTAEETTGLPFKAIELLESRGLIDEAAAAELRLKYGVEPGAAAEKAAEKAAAPVESLEAAAAENTAKSTPEEGSDEVPAIKGKTTFQELLDWGLTREEIEDVIGMPMGPTNQAVRDFFIEQGVEFSPFKDALQKRLDEK